MKLSAIPIAIVFYLFCMSAQAARYEYVGNNFNEFVDEPPPEGAYTSTMNVKASVQQNNDRIKCGRRQS